MAHRRAIYAARFLRPPSWTKRIIMREKPRELTGPYENPVRRWVRLREKARLFAQLPPPRRAPVAKPTRRPQLKPVEGVPKVHPDVLLRRLEFLLSEDAVNQQLAAPLRPGISPKSTEREAWERQMLDLRRIYRAQYLQKLAEVTEAEREKEMEMYRLELEERKRRKQAHLQRVHEDMKRRAILKDRLRIEEKVNEAMIMARQSKIKRNRLFWLRRMESLSKLIVSADNLEEVFGTTSAEVGSVSESGALLSRNVSIPFLLRQLGGAKNFPKQRSRRIPFAENVQREVLESSYDIMPEDEERFEPEPSTAVSPRERAKQLYSAFTEKEKEELLKQKVQMLEEKMQLEMQKDGKTDPITTRLRDELSAVLIASKDKEVHEEHMKTAAEARGKDPAGLHAMKKLVD